MNLANARIFHVSLVHILINHKQFLDLKLFFQVLPPRLQEWGLSPCIAEESNKKNLEVVRKEQLEVRDILKELDKRHKVITFY